MGFELERIAKAVGGDGNGFELERIADNIGKNEKQDTQDTFVITITETYDETNDVTTYEADKTYEEINFYVQGKEIEDDTGLVEDYTTNRNVKVIVQSSPNGTYTVKEVYNGRIEGYISSVGSSGWFIVTQKTENHSLYTGELTLYYNGYVIEFIDGKEVVRYLSTYAVLQEEVGDD